MIRFENEILGKVEIRFRHNLPVVEVPTSNNSLTSIVNGIKLTKGSTECYLRLGVDEWGPLYEFFGVTEVHPSDHYNKETGRVLALTRAVNEMIRSKQFSPADGRAVMVGYYSR
jgi:hypothetical protein